MQRQLYAFAAVLGLAGLFGTTAQASEGSYTVTITNLTRGTLFTPALVVTHRKGLQIFTEGEPA
ncbi:MAG: hypothetical protein OEY07_19850, partial [Gammaproteobacteria bacterium]|nr:hypothetical protein [Gammaproteobacteria bacterium]